MERYTHPSGDISFLELPLRMKLEPKTIINQTKTIVHPCQVTGVQPQPYLFLLDQYFLLMTMIIPMNRCKIVV